MAANKISKAKTEIGLADLILSMEKLGHKDDVLLNQYFQCLGFRNQAQIKRPTGDYRSNQAAWNRTRIHHRKSHKPVSKYKPIVSMPPVPETIPTVPEKKIDTAFEDLGVDLSTESPMVMPDQINSAATISEQEQTPPAVSRASLFPASKSRAVITEIVSQNSRGRDLDIKRLIEATARQKYLHALPTLPEISTRNGCQLLIDMNEALMPWWQDMQDLVQQFQAVLGTEVCPVYEFDDNPFEAFRWTEAQGELKWKCVINKPVIVATDLGVRKTPNSGLRSNVETWKNLTTFCQRRRVPLIALVPLNSTRWPKGLKSGMHIIHWNPATNAAIVKRLQRRNGNCS